MLRFLVRRLGSGFSVVAVVSFCSWLVFASALNPLSVFWPNFRSPEAEAAIARGHLHAPLVWRYWLWLEGFFSGAGFGHTVAYDEPIGPTVLPALARSVELIVFALVIAVILSVVLCWFAAGRQRSVGDMGLRGFAYLVGSVPGFLLALLLEGGFLAVDKAWHISALDPGPPTSGLGFTLRGVEDWFQHMTLPALAVAVGVAGIYSRYLRSALLDALGEPYVQVARAKGLPERTVRRRHALRAALVPFTTVIAFDFGTLFGASLGADYVFQLNGLASVFLTRALLTGDPNTIEAELVVSAAIVVLAGIVADLVCARLDPRIVMS